MSKSELHRAASLTTVAIAGVGAIAGAVAAGSLWAILLVLPFGMMLALELSLRHNPASELGEGTAPVVALQQRHASQSQAGHEAQLLNLADFRASHTVQADEERPEGHLAPVVQADFRRPARHARPLRAHA